VLNENLNDLNVVGKVSEHLRLSYVRFNYPSITVSAFERFRLHTLLWEAIIYELDITDADNPLLTYRIDPDTGFVFREEEEGAL
jgi:hypothetical protein